jgi:hypothetical protein
MINVLDPEYDNVHLATILLAQAGVQLGNGAAIVSFHIDVEKAVIVVDDESTLVYELQACRNLQNSHQQENQNHGIKRTM